ncbi:hypothetical protein BDN70DRAFT_875235 [Pholiota conissans]|uniref:Uncharacterized protein n=1 Tax=Pholiota conissans TaxID=109636 RepID=A0A9P6CWW6_9AGAR|nr:hypothetical protein BDN70DRAFT_875235 [Pholiota conissans]
MEVRRISPPNNVGRIPPKYALFPNYLHTNYPARPGRRNATQAMTLSRPPSSLSVEIMDPLRIVKASRTG